MKRQLQQQREDMKEEMRVEEMELKAKLNLLKESEQEVI